MRFTLAVSATFDIDPPGDPLDGLPVVVPLDGRFRMRRVDGLAVTWRGGSGLPLLFLPENGTTRRIFDFVLRQLPGDHPVCAVDHPGQGESGPDAGLDLRARLDGLLGLADALSWARFAVIGQGAGADLALQLASVAPDRVVAVLAADPGLVLPMPADATDWHEDWAPEVSAHWLDTAVDPATRRWRHDPAAVAALARALTDTPEPRLTQPALLFHGVHGAPPPPIAGARIACLSGGQHRLSQDSPAAFAQLIRDFLREV